ncbi:OLC1v1007845C1 [Oldenlandia corymbosa var. corymbosa]|uniref:OLC1v1007845C1 n=1 Tax=Oldenlandia corymbosa var. corymbosa TaxID=529605 RepID=A0AAV1DML4_OLDCO|nr:OLC1v1007845C1 [Oldenlandia corymbosa var. corymbosa]
MPMGAFMFLTKEQTRFGSLGNLYDSIETLNQSYIQPNQTKVRILKLIPQTFDEPFSSSPLFSSSSSSTRKDGKDFYGCSHCYLFHCFSNKSGTKCSDCNKPMNLKIEFVTPPGVEGGFVKGAGKYMVLDDLTVKPESAVDLLKVLNGRDPDTLEEKVLDISMDKALQLVKTSMKSTTVLTDVFLSNIIGGLKRKRDARTKVEPIELN